MAFRKGRADVPIGIHREIYAMSNGPALAAKLLAKRKQAMTVVMTLDIYPGYRQMRTQRIIYDERREAWMVFRYDDVEQVFLASAVFLRREP
jgi:hypothetical protein